MVTARLVDAASGWLSGRFSRRSFLVRAAVVGSAVTTSPLAYVLRPVSAYAAVCGEGASCSSGWTAMCCTVNDGVNVCPPGSFAGGWWKADGASLCGGGPRYYIDCQAYCTGGCGGGSFCDSAHWTCGCRCADGGCDQRRTCCNVFRYGQCHQEIGCSGPVVCRQISCTPPWTFEKCSTATAIDNNTVTHSAECLPSAYTAIQRRFTAIGGPRSPLGQTVRDEYDTGGVRAQNFVHGRMFWHTDTGAHYLLAPAASRYHALGGPGGGLGRLTADDVAISSIGRRATFENGVMWTSPRTGAHAVTGAVLDHYAGTGAEHGPVGYPVTDTAPTADGIGRFSHFEHGSIYWAPTTGAHTVAGAIRDKWAAMHWESGTVGYPTSDATAGPDGASTFVTFERGSVWARPGIGTFAVYGSIQQSWDANGGATGPLGLPRSDTSPTPDGAGRQSVFDGGTVTSRPDLGAHALWGVINDRWLARGGVTGDLGFPTSDVLTESDGSHRATFEHGTLTDR